MGFYIETGSNRGKARYIVENFSGQYISITDAVNLFESGDTSQAVIVVVDNGLFEAAAFAYSKGELEYFLNDRRPKVFVAMPRELAERLTGYRRV